MLNLRLKLPHECAKARGQVRDVGGSMISSHATCDSAYEFQPLRDPLSARKHTSTPRHLDKNTPAHPHTAEPIFGSSNHTPFVLRRPVPPTDPTMPAPTRKGSSHGPTPRRAPRARRRCTTTESSSWSSVCAACRNGESRSMQRQAARRCHERCKVRACGEAGACRAGVRGRRILGFRMSSCRARTTTTA